jgi:Tol biopolymer transport system component
MEHDSLDAAWNHGIVSSLEIRKIHTMRNFALHYCGIFLLGMKLCVITYPGEAPGASPALMSGATDVVLYTGTHDDPKGDIYLYSRTGRKRLTTSPHYDGQPSPSPDGRSIVFVSDRSSTQSLYLLDMRDSTVTRLTNTAGVKDFAPAFSPKGDRIAFIRIPLSAYSWYYTELYVLNLKDSSVLRLTDNVRGERRVFWSSNGKEVFYSDTEDIWAVPVAGGKERLVKKIGEDCYDAIKTNLGIIVYREQRSVLFRSNYAYELCILRPGQKKGKRMTNLKGVAGRASVSKDESSVVFSFSKKFGGRQSIYRIDINGDNLEELTTTYGNSVSTK